jgi:DNA-binding transcriptional ArsR family regulator
MTEQEVVRALDSIAHLSRLQIFRLLVVSGKSGTTPKVLSETLGIPATGLSFHLKELTHSGLITQERDGRNLIYRAAFTRMNELVSFLTLNCCEGQVCELADAQAACKAC